MFGSNLPPSTVDGLVTLAALATAIGGKHAAALAEIKELAVTAREDINKAELARADMATQLVAIANDRDQLAHARDAHQADKESWAAELASERSALAHIKSQLMAREQELIEREQRLFSAEQDYIARDAHLQARAAELETEKADTVQLRKQLDEKLAKIQDAIG